MRLIRATRAVLAVIVAVGALDVGAVGAQDAAVDGDHPCAEAFVVADAIERAMAASPVGSDAGVEAVLLDLTIATCASAREWLTTAAAHPVVAGDADPRTTLAARCADPTTELATAPACTAPALVALPKVKPRVKGVRRTRYYPIVGLSPDELFTQMQLNGSSVCPTHAVACVNIQPVLRPLVSAGGSCRVMGIQASLAIEAALPRWAGPARVYPELVAWWRKVATRIGRHEAQHIRIAERQLARLRRDIIGRPCSSLSAYVARWSRALTAEQDAFDAKELERPWPPYDGPLP